MDEIEQVGLEQAAAKLWAGFNASQKCGVRFGMFPVEITKEYPDLDGRLLVLELMNCAKADERLEHSTFSCDRTD